MLDYIIGMDIGGTNTDAVLIDRNLNLLHEVKTPTTKDITTGFQEALKKLLQQSKAPLKAIKAISLGTTHATNALLQKKDLYKVSVLRLAGQQPDSIPPCFDWPEDLRKEVFHSSITLNGGFECSGETITPLKTDEIEEAIERLLNLGMESLAVIGVFSPLYRDQELKVAEILKKVAPHCPISLSHEVGGIGFIERENTTILNAALKKVMSKGFLDLEKACFELDLTCPLYITQNNGSRIDLKRAIDYPVLTISAGPTNSFIGAARLTGLHDAVVVDIGGTSTDVGSLKNGFPRRSLNSSQIGGVKLNFSMPDVRSIALGGGSYIDIDQKGFSIGPKSAGSELLNESQCFGGNRLTFTDIALLHGHLAIPGASVGHIKIQETLKEAILEEVLKKIRKEVQIMDGKDEKTPILLVGGGSYLIPNKRLDERYHLPKHAHVANAFGAALAEISATVDTVVSLTNRDSTLKKLEEDALNLAIAEGASPHEARIVEKEIIPYHYIPNQMARVRITAAGKGI